MPKSSPEHLEVMRKYHQKRKAEGFKRIITPEQKKRNLEQRKRRRKADPKYREYVNSYSRKRYWGMTDEQKKEYKKYGKEYAKTWRKNAQKRFEKTKDLKLYFQFKRRLINKARHKKWRKHGVSLTAKDLEDQYHKQNGKCYYTNEEFFLSIYGTYPKDSFEYLNTLTVDRIDSSKGYHKDNIVLSTLKANSAKSTLTTDQFIELCKKIYFNFKNKR